MPLSLRLLAFESSVNSEYSKTPSYKRSSARRFESSVNSEYSKTTVTTCSNCARFESSVNSEYSKTKKIIADRADCLRVV